MAVETPNRLHATGLFAPVPAAPFTTPVIAAKGVRSFTRLAAGQYVVELDSPLTFHEGDVRVGLPPNLQAIVGGQVLPNGTIFVAVLSLGTGVPVDPSWFALQVFVWNEGEGEGVIVPALPIPPPLPSGSGVITGNGSPEGVVVATVGVIYSQLDAVGGPVVWYKRTGVGNTGWAALVGMAAALGGAPNITGQMFLGMSSTGQVPTGQLHGSNAGIQYSSDISNRAQARFNQYGANAGAPGITTFKSRGAFGLPASVIAGDILGRWTTIGISADNTSLNLASFLTIYAEGAPTATKVPCRAELELTTLAGNRELALRVTSEGELSAKGPIGPGNSTAAGATTGPRWRTGVGSPEGVVVGSPGDIYSSTDPAAAPGTTLWVKESGVATNTGWVSESSFAQVILPFAANINLAGAGFFLVSNGNAQNCVADPGISSVAIQWVQPKTTRLSSISWSSESADATTTFDIAINGIVVQTVALTGTFGTLPIGPHIALFNEPVAVRHNAGTVPGKILFTLS